MESGDKHETIEGLNEGIYSLIQISMYIHQNIYVKFNFIYFKNTFNIIFKKDAEIIFDIKKLISKFDCLFSVPKMQSVSLWVELVIILLCHELTSC